MDGIPLSSAVTLGMIGQPSHRRRWIRLAIVRATPHPSLSQRERGWLLCRYLIAETPLSLAAQQPALSEAEGKDLGVQSASGRGGRIEYHHPGLPNAC